MNKMWTEIAHSYKVNDKGRLLKDTLPRLYSKLNIPYYKKIDIGIKKKISQKSLMFTKVAFIW